MLQSVLELPASERHGAPDQTRRVVTASNPEQVECANF